MTKHLLMILQPRCIPDCVDSLAALPVDKVWFRAFDESSLAPEINGFVERTNYRDYLIVADDVVVSIDAYRAVAAALNAYEAVTGWCEVDASVPWANVTRAPLRLGNGKVPVASDYSFYRVDEIREMASPYFPTWFAGWALTGFRRKLWLRFPFAVNPVAKAQSDFQTSYRLQAAGVPIVGVRDGYMQHLRRDTTPLKDNWIVGRETPRVVFEEYRACRRTLRGLPA